MTTAGRPDRKTACGGGAQKTESAWALSIAIHAKAAAAKATKPLRNQRRPRITVS